MEYLSQYEYSITYIKGEDNTVTDTLTRMLITEAKPLPILAIFSIENDPTLFTKIQKGYGKDTWCASILDDIRCRVMDSKLNIKLENELLFIGSHLIIPKYLNLHESLYCLAHDHLGHFRGEKSYASL